MRRVLSAVIVSVLLASLGTARGYDVDHPPAVCPKNSTCAYLKEKSSTDSFYYLINGSNLIEIVYRPSEKYFLRCKKIPLSLIDNLPVLTEQDDVEEVEIYNCKAPDRNMSYYDIFKLWNITLTKTLRLTRQPAEPRLQGHHLRDMPINKLIIENDGSENPLRPSQDFVSGVAELLTLRLKNVIPDVQAFIQFPDKLETLDLEYAQVPAAVSKLGNGSAWLERLLSLKTLFIQESPNDGAEPLILPTFNISLRNLTNLTLIDVPLNSSSLTGKLNGSSIKSLDLQYCGLNNLSYNVFKGANLTHLTIKHHKLTVPRGIFSPLQWLAKLDLTDNNLDGATVLDAVSSLPRLQKLVASYNPLGSLCGDADVISAESKWPKSLQHLELVKTNATRICPEWVENDELMQIELQNNNIGDLTYNDLIMKRAIIGPTAAAQPVMLDLTNNPNLRIVKVSSTDKLQCHNDSVQKDSNNRTRAKVLVTIEMSDVRCDHGGYLLQEALRDCPLWLMPSNSNHDTDRLCPYSGRDCLPECTCSKRLRDNATVVKCQGALPLEPRWPASSRDFPLVLYAAPGTLAAVPTNIDVLLELHAPNNSISRLDGSDVANMLELDVSYNRIQHISESAARRLIAEETIRVELKGNRFDCNCSDVPAYELLASSKAVRDWKEALCADNIHVMEKMKSGLCFPFWPLALGLGCLLLFVLAIGLLLHFCKLQIRQVLFKLNCCRRYIFRVNDDIEKEKDVFLSYCHENLEQMNIIKKYLEERGYSTIEHNRDFEPGDPILSQIVEAVQKARRTLVLVSNHFMQSKWMEHEFRYAHTHALKYQTSKVVVVLYNFSKETLGTLPPDLRYYIKHHTYIDWHEENFWVNLSKFLGKPKFQVVDHKIA
ncbi:protein toll-like [Cydia fagiglandana]|uniref:protein toll-like n=1 Tax=Cydia fagiglandana TaxID=1458189 RepID=UPI002FEE54A5